MSTVGVPPLVKSFAFTSGPAGATPAQIRHAYGFDQLSFNNGSVAADGTGTTIAIVDAFQDPNIVGDLHQFDSTFGIPDLVGSAFSIINQTGGSTLPALALKGNWGLETSLDVEWAHAIAPKASILLVETNDDSLANEIAGASFAGGQTGVVVVSMSWGAAESKVPNEASYDSNFTTQAGHSGVTFVAASGDSGAPPSYPAVSPNVLAVGGTTLNIDISGNLTSAGETGWGASSSASSGGGVSAQEPLPGYQNTVGAQLHITNRGNPDVSYAADPEIFNSSGISIGSGFSTYDSYDAPTTPFTGNWVGLEGTSAGAPQWAALIAIANQGRALSNLGSLDGPSQTLPMLYGFAAADFRDITTGTSQGNPPEAAGTGYDLVTGRGSPVVKAIVTDFVGLPRAVNDFYATLPNEAITVGAPGVLYNDFQGITAVLGINPSDAASGGFALSPNGQFTYTPKAGWLGEDSFTYTAQDSVGVSSAATVKVYTIPATGQKLVAMATDVGAGGEVKVLAVINSTLYPAPVFNISAPAMALRYDFFPYFVDSQKFQGGVRVAIGDVNGDGVPDIITAPGPDSNSMVPSYIKVYDASTPGLTPTRYPGAAGRFYAYAPAWFGGVFVAAGTVAGGTVNDIVTGPDAGGGPDVRVFTQPYYKDSETPTPFMEFNAYNAVWKGGVRVAAADTNGDGRADIITGPGAGGGPEVKVFSGNGGGVLQDFFAYSPQFAGGVYVSGGKFDHTVNYADIITGPGAGGGPNVIVFNGSNVNVIYSFFAYDPVFVGGARVGYISAIDGDGNGELLTAAGPPGGADLRLFGDGNGANLLSAYELSPWIATVLSGFFVAGD